MSVLTALLVVATLHAPQQVSATLPKSLDLTAARSLPTQHDGRWPPLDTVARDLVEQVTDTMDFQGHDPVAVLLAWTFDSKTWMDQPLIEIKNAEVRKELQLSSSKTVFSYSELMHHEYLMSLIREVSRMTRGGKMDPLETKVSDISGKLETLQRIFGGEAIALIPDPELGDGAWQPVTLRGKSSGDDAVRSAWADLGKAFLADDATAFAASAGRLSSALAALPAAYRPDPSLIETELLYNRLRPFHIAALLMVIGAMLAVVALLVRHRLFDVATILPLVAGFIVLSYGLWLRWQIAGRIPASNMFESLLFLSWGMGLFAILARAVFSQRLIPLTASGMAALALFLADALPLDSFVRPIVPVLQDTVWMSIHVPVIMVSYSVLALGVLVAHVQLGVMAAAPRRRQLAAAMDSLHYWYIHVGSILLFAGVATGSMWAASSWGRYWGWDPKEVWSLVALLGYLTILHVRVGRETTPAWAYAVAAVLAVGVLVMIAPRLGPITPGKTLALVGTVLAMLLMVLARGQFATAVKSILCFWLIIMTYVGVNYVLNMGLHSYGFGTGTVATKMFTIGGIDLTLVALLAVVHLIRRDAAGSVEEPATARAHG